MGVRSNPKRDPLDRSAGFTFVEVLVISLLVAAVLLSLVPLFSNSMNSNREGWTSTEAVAFGRTELEDKSAMRLDRPAFVVTGMDVQNQTNLVWDRDQHQWFDPTDSGAPATTFWEQTTRIRQYSISDLQGPPDEERRFDDPLSGEIDPRYVHFREINVWVEHQLGADVAAAPGASRGLDATVLRSY